MDVIFKNIYINRVAIEKLARVTGNICTIVGISTIFTMASLYFIVQNENELEQRIEYLEGDNTSKKGE